MKDISDSYLDRYRRKLADIESIDSEVREIRKRYEKELSDISSRRTRVENEIQEMRQVITTMIDQGVDPVEAKLRNSQRRETIWENTKSEKVFGLSSITLDPNNSVFESITTDILYGPADVYSDPGGSSNNGY